MENQHRKIVGYRELTQEDIDLMNAIKAKGRELLELQERVARRVTEQVDRAGERASREEFDDQADFDAALADLNRLQRAEPARWAAIAKTDLQTGVMALVRAVAQPTDC